MRITTRDIIAATAERYRLGIDELLGRRQARRFSRPRQIAMVAARRFTTDSLPKIGRAFHRDHTTIFSALAALEREPLPIPVLYEIVIAAQVIAARRQMRDLFNVQTLKRTGRAILEPVE